MVSRTYTLNVCVVLQCAAMKHPSHSGLTALERQKDWQKAKHKRLGMVIDTRAATFMPFADLGMIIVDEENIKILDIGTGSGCIAVALAKKIPNAEIFALDISTQALEVAKQNAEKHQVNIQFIEGDILNCDLNSDFDIIVSNPPYVRELEMKDMANNVKKYEPKTIQKTLIPTLENTKLLINLQMGSICL